jgi:VWFA-related protein
MILRRYSSARALASRLASIAAALVLLAQSAGSQDAKPAPAAQAPPPQAASASQPQQAQGPPITSDTKLVTMLAAVRDKHGNFVRDLKQQDFTVQQDGHPQTITYFAQDPNIRLTVGLLVDTSLSQRRVLDQERSASGAFLDKMFDSGDALASAAPTMKPASTPAGTTPADAKSAITAPPPRDQAFIVRFDYEVELEQDITSNRQKLEDALSKMNAPEFSRGGSSSSSNPDDPDSQNGNGGGRHRGGHGAGTLLYDAIYLSSEDLMKKQQGRKALVLLTDGDDRGSKESLENAIEAAQRADTLVYSILFKDNDAYGNGGYGGPYGGGGGRGGGMGGGRHGGGGYPQQESRPDGKKVLERISRETGGRFFEVTKKQSIDDIYAAINDELRSQYSIGYKPEPADAGPGYHKIQLSTNRKDLAVQTREGYYAK